MSSEQKLVEIRNNKNKNVKKPSVKPRICNIFSLSLTSNSILWNIDPRSSDENSGEIQSIPSAMININSDLETDVEFMLSNMKNNKINYSKIVKMIVYRTASHRSQIRQTLMQKYTIEIIQNFNLAAEQIVIFNLLWFSGPDLDAYIIHFGFVRHHYLSKILRKVLCTKSYEEIQAIIEAFNRIFNSDLVSMVKKSTTGSQRMFYMTLFNTKRSTSTSFPDSEGILINFKKFKDKNYYKTNKNTFIKIFTSMSFYQIKKMCDLYRSSEITDPENMFIGGFKSELKKCAKTICQYSRNHLTYFTKVLRNDIIKHDIIGIFCLLITRCEIDLLTITRLMKNTFCAGYDLKMAFLNEPFVYHFIVKPLSGFSL